MTFQQLAKTKCPQAGWAPSVVEGGQISGGHTEPIPLSFHSLWAVSPHRLEACLSLSLGLTTWVKREGRKGGSREAIPSTKLKKAGLTHTHTHTRTCVHTHVCKWTPGHTCAQANSCSGHTHARMHTLCVIVSSALRGLGKLQKHTVISNFYPHRPHSLHFFVLPLRAKARLFRGSSSPRKGTSLPANSL